MPQDLKDPVVCICCLVMVGLAMTFLFVSFGG